MCSRIKPTTTWGRDRYTFGITDIHGAILVDIHGNEIKGITDTNPLITSWT